MRYLVAPDKFKGTLSADEVAEIIGLAIQSVDRSAEIELLPIADGGEGTAALLAHHSHAQRQIIETVDPLGRSIEAEYFVRGSEAILEMSAASGLWRIDPANRTPLEFNTYGTGIILWHLVEQGIQKILIGLGGSATVDAGLGMAAALGYRFEDKHGRPVDPIPSRFSEIRKVTPPIIERFPETVGLADVENRLTGPEGAIYVYGPQKGLSPAEVEQLDFELQALVKRLEGCLGADFSDADQLRRSRGLWVWHPNFPEREIDFRFPDGCGAIETFGTDRENRRRHYGRREDRLAIGPGQGSHWGRKNRHVTEQSRLGDRRSCRGS